MAELPATRYAQTVGGVRIASDLGDGPRDVVVVRDASTPIDCLWEEPRIVQMLERLGSFCRNIWFDARGWGSSDALTLGALPGLDAWLDDISAVMASAGSPKAALCGMNDGGSPTILFAATYPQRVSALVPVNTYLSPGVSLCPDDLAWLMIIVSDDVATALLALEIGGPEAVNRTMSDLELTTAPLASFGEMLAGAPFGTSTARDLAEAYTHLGQSC